MGRKSGENLGMTYCHNLGGNQVFAYTKRQQIMSDDNCLDASNKNGPIKLVRCHGMGGNQAWAYDQVVSGGAWCCGGVTVFRFSPFPGQDRQACEHGELPAEARPRRHEPAAAQALQLQPRSAVDHGERLQVAGSEPPRREIGPRQRVGNVTPDR